MVKFLIVIPAHNEEESIVWCLQSLLKQTYADFEIIVVDDGSTDRTKKLVEELALGNSNLTILSLPESEHQPGAKVVRTFNHGLQSVQLENYDVICKFDADIIFPSDYLEKIAAVYRENPDAGMVSGLVRIKAEKSTPVSDADAFEFNDSSGWSFENISSKNHVRGPIKSYRKECFQSMHGLRPVLGWDNIDVMLAQMHGWKVITLKDIWVKHLRPTAYKYKKDKAKKLGAYFHNIGLSLPLAALSAAKSAFKNRSLSEFFTILSTFAVNKEPLQLSRDEVKYIRKLRWNEVMRNFSK